MPRWPGPEAMESERRVQVLVEVLSVGYVGFGLLLGFMGEFL